MTRSLRIAVEGAGEVSALLDEPGKAVAGCVLAHGAGAGMTHAFMAAVGEGLARRSIACLRYQFPYMERGSRRPDRAPLAQAAVRAAVAAAGHAWPGLPLFAAGKSFGGRMSSLAQAQEPLAGVLGLVFFGFPLHPPRKPSADRAAHLADVSVPMLFLQGTRDDLADLALLRPVVSGLGPRATLRVFEDADHSFHVRKRSGRSDEEVMAEMLDVAAGWMHGLC